MVCSVNYPKRKVFSFNVEDKRKNFLLQKRHRFEMTAQLWEAANTGKFSTLDSDPQMSSPSLLPSHAQYASSKAASFSKPLSPLLAAPASPTKQSLYLKASTATSKHSTPQQLKSSSGAPVSHPALRPSSGAPSTSSVTTTTTRTPLVSTVEHHPLPRVPPRQIEQQVQPPSQEVSLRTASPSPLPSASSSQQRPFIHATASTPLGAAISVPTRVNARANARIVSQSLNGPYTTGEFKQVGKKVGMRPLDRSKSVCSHRASLRNWKAERKFRRWSKIERKEKIM